MHERRPRGAAAGARERVHGRKAESEREAGRVGRLCSWAPFLPAERAASVFCRCEREARRQRRWQQEARLCSFRAEAFVRQGRRYDSAQRARWMAVQRTRRAAGPRGAEGRTCLARAILLARTHAWGGTNGWAGGRNGARWMAALPGTILGETPGPRAHSPARVAWRAPCPSGLRIRPYSVSALQLGVPRRLRWRARLLLVRMLGEASC
jgi:hypothetical protein